MLKMVTFSQKTIDIKICIIGHWRRNVNCPKTVRCYFENDNFSEVATVHLAMTKCVPKQLVYPVKFHCFSLTLKLNFSTSLEAIKIGSAKKTISFARAHFFCLDISPIFSV